MKIIDLSQTFTLADLHAAWDAAIAGSTVGKLGCSRDSASFNALVAELQKRAGRKLKPKRRARHA